MTLVPVKTYSYKELMSWVYKPYAKRNDAINHDGPDVLVLAKFISAKQIEENGVLHCYLKFDMRDGCRLGPVLKLARDQTNVFCNMVKGDCYVLHYHVIGPRGSLPFSKMWSVLYNVTRQEWSCKLLGHNEFR